MPKQALTSAQVLAMLAATPPRIAALAAGLTPAQVHASPSHNQWSMGDVLAHLRACADVWGNCIELMLTQDAPTIRAVNPTTWIKGTAYHDQAFQPALQAFATQRTTLLALLHPLPHQSWLRAATVTGAGHALERTVLAYAQRLARHERTHLKQIERIAHTLRP